MFLFEASDTLRGLTRLERRLLDVARVELYTAARVAFQSARETTLFRDRTGKLRDSIEIVDNGAFEKTLIARAKHGLFIEAGTKAHVIRPKKARMLRFISNGEIRFARKVNHPGTAKRPFMENAARAGGQALRVSFVEGVDKAIEGA